MIAIEKRKKKENFYKWVELLSIIYNHIYFTCFTDCHRQEERIMHGLGLSLSIFQFWEQAVAASWPWLLQMFLKNAL